MSKQPLAIGWVVGRPDKRREFEFRLPPVEVGPSGSGGGSRAIAACTSISADAGSSS